MEIVTLILVAEAAFSVALAKQRGERLTEAVSFLIVSILLATMDLVELASRVSGVPAQLFSIASARRVGVELIRSAEETLAAATRWSYYLSIASSAAIAAVTIVTAVKGAVVISAFLVQSGINALQSVANAYLVVSSIYRFVGQLFVVLAEAAARLRPLLPLAGLLMIPKVTRRLGASLLTLAVIMTFVIPVLVNLWGFSTAHSNSAPEGRIEVGAIRIGGFVRAPVASIEGGNVSAWEEAYPMPPGGVAVYVGHDGRKVARLLGQWYLEKVSEYTLRGVAYAGFWLPAGEAKFKPKEYVQSSVICASGSEFTPSCWFEVSGPMEITFEVRDAERSIVLFYDASGGAKGWGYWTARGFFVLKGSERLEGPIRWYNVSGFLGNHQLVAILHPSYCETEEGSETIRVKIESNREVNVTVRYVEVTAWIEGHFDPEDLCKNGVPKVLRRGLSRLQVSGESVDAEPVLSCEVAYVEPSLRDAREAEAEWFNQWARLINASFPASSDYSWLRRCIYGRGVAEAIVLNGNVFYSRSLWQRHAVPRVVVRARYYGDLVNPAIIGPVRAGFQPFNFSVALPLLGGDPECPNLLELSISDKMDERVVAGLFFDSDLEPLINGSVASTLKGIVTDILGNVGRLALLATSLSSVAFSAIFVASLLGGFVTPPSHIFKPFHFTFHGLEQLGKSLFSLAKEILIVGSSKRKLRNLKEPSTLTALDLSIEIRRSIERLREGSGYRRRGFKGAVKRAIRAWQAYVHAHPIPALLRAASEVALRAAVSRVGLNVSYVEKLRLALRDPMARRLIVASDVLYAASLLMDSKLGTWGPALRYVKRFARGYRLVYPREMSEKDLREIRRPKLELERALAAVARDILRGRDPSRNLAKVERVVELYPQLKVDFEYYFGGSLSGSLEELVRKIVSLAAAKGFTRRELFELLERYLSVALFVADRTAVDRTVVRGEWIAAIAEKLSKLSRDRGAEADLGAVWLSSYERGELWRYLIIRTAWEVAEGSEPWFLSKLHPEVKLMLVEVARAIAAEPTSVDLKSALMSEKLDDQAARFLRGYSDALKNEFGISLSGAVEAFILSGDAYWAGWAAALAQKQGGAIALAQEIVDSQLGWFGPRAEGDRLMKRVAGFLERAYRELANAVINLEEKLKLLEGGGLSLPPGMSVALTIAEQAELERLASKLRDLHQGLCASIDTMNALLAECSELKREACARELYGSRQCADALRQWQKLAARALNDFYELKKRVEDELRLVGG